MEMGQAREICEYFIWMLDELDQLSDVCDVAQLIVFLRTIFTDVTSKELLKTVTLHWKYTAEDKFQINYTVFWK
jgi:hypothetical protein